MWQFSSDLMVIFAYDCLKLHSIGPPFVLLHAPPLSGGAIMFPLRLSLACGCVTRRDRKSVV